MEPSPLPLGLHWVGLLVMGMTEPPQLVAQVQAEYRTVKAILEERARFAT